MNKAVFIDRDGTIARDVHYCRRPEDIHCLPTAGDGLKLLSHSDLKLIMVTNQSGIARGYFNVETLDKIHAKMMMDIGRYGARLDAIYYCPLHPGFSRFSKRSEGFE